MSKGFYQGITSEPNKLQDFSFGESDFKGSGIYYSCLRWWRQFTTLVKKNSTVLIRRPYQLIASLIIPGLLVLVLILGNNPYIVGTSTESISNTQTPTPLQGLGACDAFDSFNCLQVAFFPDEAPYSDIMIEVAEMNGLNLGTDIIGFDRNDTLKNYVAENLGSVQFSVFFPNETIWLKNDGADQDPLSNAYVIYYNSSRSSHDPRSKKHNVNFPLLVLQKSIEHALLNHLNRIQTGSAFSSVIYDASYAQTWAFVPPEPIIDETYYNYYGYGAGQASNQTCDAFVPEKNFDSVGVASTYVFCFGFHLLGVLAFQILIDERQKGLVKSLRRLGLMDSAYWSAVLFTYQVVIVCSTIIALIIAAIIEPTTYVVQKLDFGVLFLFVWLSLTCAYCNAFFLSTVTTSGVIATTIIFFNFLTCLLTLLFIGPALNTYGLMPIYAQYDDGQQYIAYYVCEVLASGYNQVFDNRQSVQLAEFVLFWMPWYHTGTVITDVLFEIEYGRSFAYSDLQQRVTMFDELEPIVHTFQAKSAGNALGFMVLSSLIYMLLAWYFGQWMDGIPVGVILVPNWLRRALNGSEGTRVVDGDVRGMERLASQQAGSIRAYKVSKTYKGVQALKEVSFSINIGEVFTLLGHNGAGKSTLFNILSGVTPTTHGKVYVAGFDVDYEMTELQQFIGVCPQDDYLWDELTALEHMRIHAQFKGIPIGPTLDAACLNVLTLVKLGDRANTLAKDFSGGMKRRLSAAMSIVGSVKVLYLDEPTTGLDPLSRRAIWDMVSLIKKDRVVVLTTHNLEEADFLGDRVLILQTGQVKALGDPLYLKQTYGSGYQVRVTVDSKIATPVSQDILKFLPRSSVSGDISAGAIVVQVNKADYDNLARFLAWLERNQEKSQAIKEWMISNTSLEQVFLKLVESSTVNYTSDDQAAGMNLCPLCQKRSRAPVVLLALRGTNNLLLPDSICDGCTAINHYLLTEEECAPLIAPPPQAPEAVKEEHLRTLTRTLQQRRALAWSHEPLNLSASYGNSDDTALLSSDKAALEEIESRDYLMQDAHNGESSIPPSPPPSVGVVIPSGQEVGPILVVPQMTVSQVAGVRSSRKAQVNALMMKNITLQLYQPCSTCCVLFFTLLMFGALYIIGILFVVSSNSCPGGYYTYSGGCTVEDLANTLFFDNDHYYYIPGSTAEERSFGYDISRYLIPTRGYVRGTYTLKGRTYNDYIYALYGFDNRDPGFRVATVWSPLVTPNLTAFLEHQSVYYPVNTSVTSDLNQYMYEQQALTYESQASSAYPECRLYSPYSFAGQPTDSLSAAEVAFSARFADGMFTCHQCSEDQQFFFNGSVFVNEIHDPAYYQYAFVDYVSSNYGNVDVCPTTFKALTLAGYNYIYTNRKNQGLYGYYYYYRQDNTMQSMEFINMLTNSMYDQTLTTFAIQGGVSGYTTVNYEVYGKQALLLILTLIASMMMNGIFPMAVWRIAYERSSNLRLMMNTVGLKPTSYVLGMYTFDFVTMSLVSGIAMIVVVESKLSLFSQAPLGYLIAVALVSAHALSGLALVVVRLTPKGSRLITLVSTITSLVLTVVAVLLSSLKYTTDGSWPNGLSIIPFFAQARAIQVLLNHHHTTHEVDVAIGLMFLFGTVCIMLELILDWELMAIVSAAVRKLIPSTGRAPSLGEVGPSTSDIEMHHIYSAEDAEIDLDVQNELQLAQQYQPHSGQHAHCAVVIHKLTQIFNVSGKPLTAVNDLSLVLNYGEVFTLLGPNGAGKSTILSIISGVFQPTLGDVHVAGINIREDLALVASRIGVCPQFDIVWQQLTVEEHLYFQARQRGVSDMRLTAEVQRIAIQVGLDGDAFKSAAGTLSGGQRRRLSIAMSIVGDPPIIFLDEPSSGLDPGTRKELWNLINALKKPDRLILLTTHSMEEAETLSTRIGIISSGALRCIGTTVHLKHKFSLGYTVEINRNIAGTAATTTAVTVVGGGSGATAEDAVVPSRNTDGNNVADAELDQFIETNIALGQGSSLLTAINNTRRYTIPKQNIKISRIFSEMEENKKRLNIREWGMSETSLEDIFIAIVSKH